MKRYLVLCLLLSSCSTKVALMSSADIVAISQAESACYQAQSTKYQTMTSEGKLASDAIDAVLKATGKYVDPCKHMTNNELQAVVAQEETKRWAVVGDAGKSIVSSGVTLGLGLAGIDALKDIFSNYNSSNITFNGEATVSESFNPANYTFGGDVDTFSFTNKPLTEYILPEPVQ